VDCALVQNSLTLAALVPPKAKHVPQPNGDGDSFRPPLAVPDCGP
jgi:hypothetical protein